MNWNKGIDLWLKVLIYLESVLLGICFYYLKVLDGFEKGYEFYLFWNFLK